MLEIALPLQNNRKKVCGRTRAHHLATHSQWHLLVTPMFGEVKNGICFDRRCCDAFEMCDSYLSFFCIWLSELSGMLWIAVGRIYPIGERETWSRLHNLLLLFLLFFDATDITAANFLPFEQVLKCTGNPFLDLDWLRSRIYGYLCAMTRFTTEAFIPWKILNYHLIWIELAFVW